MAASAEQLRRENAPVAVKKLVSFVLTDFQKACSFRHLLTVFESLGAMFPVAVMMRAATVSRRTAVRIDFASDDPVVLLLDETPFFLGIQHLNEEEEIAELFRDSELGQFVGLARPGERYHTRSSAPSALTSAPKIGEKRCQSFSHVPELS
jgi:hypothetical protein